MHTSLPNKKDLAINHACIFKNAFKKTAGCGTPCGRRPITLRLMIDVFKR